MAKEKVLFAPIPIRALGDRQLTEIHLRALGVVAYHDRMSLATGKGQGCWASTATMAKEMGGYNLTNVSTAISQLAKWGYLKVDKRPDDKRLRIYRVDFADADNLPQGQTIDDDDYLPDGQTIDQNPTQDNLPEGNQSGKVICPRDHSNDGNSSLFPSQEISLSEVINSAEAVKINSAEAAHFASRNAHRDDFNDRKIVSLPRRKSGAEAPAIKRVSIFDHLPSSFPRLSMEAKVIRFEEAFAAIGRNAAALSSREHKQWSDWLYALSDECYGEPLGYQALRLMDEMTFPDGGEAYHAAN